MNKTPPTFCQLHLHTHIGSQLDGIGDPEQYAKLAKEMGHPSLAVTDHGKMNAFYKHQEACLAEGIKPIFGVEAYVEFELERFEEKAGKQKRVRNKNMHLILLAKNEAGYKNLLKLNYLSNSDEKHYYYRNHITIKEIFENKEGLIIGSGCGNSPFNTLFREGEEEKADKLYGLFTKEFGDDFYTEIHLSELYDRDNPDDTYDQKRINDFELRMAKKYDRKIVLAGDVHYQLPGKDQIQTLAIAIRNRDTIDNITFEIESKNLYYHDVSDYHKFNEMWNYGYTKEQIDEWCRNAKEIADRCNYLIPERNKMILPTISEDDDSLIIQKAREGLAKRFEVENYEDCPKEYKDRLSTELSVIIRKGMSNYVLVLEDIFRFADRENIVRGPARGCFTSNNKVLMADGSHKNISDVNIGDRVISGDGNIRDCLSRFVYDVDEEIIEIELEDGTKIECTEDHKIMTQDGWKKARDLTPYDELVKVNTERVQ